MQNIATVHSQQFMHMLRAGTDSEMPKIRRGPQVNTPKPFDYHNTANTFQKRFAAWVLKCHIPPEYLSQTDLHSALETIGGAPPSRDDVLGGWLNTLYNDEKAQILHSITMAGEFAIAMDGWKKREGESGPPVVTVNVHLPKGGTAFWKVRFFLLFLFLLLDLNLVYSMISVLLCKASGLLFSSVSSTSLHRLDLDCTL